MNSACLNNKNSMNNVGKINDGVAKNSNIKE